MNDPRDLRKDSTLVENAKKNPTPLTVPPPSGPHQRDTRHDSPSPPAPSPIGAPPRAEPPWGSAVPPRSDPPWAADLRQFPREDRARFVDTVTYGKRGMPPWDDVLKPDDIEALWAYVVAEGKK